MKKKEIVGDVMLSLGQVSDDHNIPERQVCHWINLAREHHMNLESLDEEDKNILKKKVCLEVEREESCKEGCSQFVINLPYDMTDVMLYRENGKTSNFEMASGAGHFDILCTSRFSNCIIWYRCGSKIYFNDKIPQEFKVIVEHIPSNVSDCDDNDCVVVPRLGLTITEDVKRIGLNQIRIPLDDNSEGRDDKGAQ